MAISAEALEVKVETRGSKRAGRHLIHIAIIAAIAFAVFSPVLNYFFAQDDFRLLEANQVDSWRDLLAYSEELLFYRPVTARLFWFLARGVFGLNPSGYHVINLLLHIANSALLYLAIYRVARREVVAFITAFLFAIHGVHFRTVFTIYSSGDTIVALFFLLAFLLYIQINFPHERKTKCAFYGASLVCYLLGIFSKEAAIVLPGVALLYDWTFAIPAEAGLRSKVSILSRSLPLFFVTALCVGLVALLFGIPVSPGDHYAFSFSPGVMFRNFTWYLFWSVSFFPTQILDLKRALLPDLHTFNIYTQTAVFLGFLALCVVLFWRSGRFQAQKQKTGNNHHPRADAANDWSPKFEKIVVFGIGWFVINLLPVIFLPNEAGPRYLYIPLMGLLLPIGYVLSNALQRLKNREAVRGRAVRVIFVVVVSLASLAAVRQMEQTSPYAAAMRAAQGYISDTRALLPDLPRGSTLYLIGMSEEDQYTLWYGAAFRVFYQDETLLVRFVAEDEIPENAGEKAHLLRRENGRLVLLDSSYTR